MKSLELIIFDCDGVLVDSERITNQILATMLNELGIPVTMEYMFEHFVGRSMAQDMELINVLLGAPPPSDFVENFRRRTGAALAASLKPVAGIEFVLDQIDLPYCVASSGDHQKMQTTLGITGLLPRFAGKLFSVKEVANPKPAPDVFLLAAQRNGIAPSTCLVIEDTPTGVTAAVAAGMTVFGYSALTPAYRLSAAGAHRVFDSMFALPALIKNAALL
ncbi:MAG: HAD family hydrolase [Candidatus Obscuribacterales bacterium]|nr:HAD family hydrolase [Steroidobacteraceae bacterium]